MTTKEQIAVIVDPYSSGVHLAPELARRGWSAVAVLSSPTIRAAYGSLKHVDRYREVITAGDDIDHLVAAVREHAPAAVIAGSEIGVALADQLAERLGLPGNGAAGTSRRRNKNAMADALVHNGVPAAPTTIASDVDGVVRWADEKSVWPIVVKPVDSGGSDGICFCTTPAEVAAAFQQLHNKPSQLGGDNEKLLAQKQLHGQQYYVNTVSLDGQHYVCEIWKDVRRPVLGASPVYDVEDLLAPTGELQGVLARYTTRVLDALGVRWGPAHSEIMLTDQGPILIETGARMQGAILPDSVRAATGHSLVTLTVDCYAEPEQLRRLLGQPYALNRQLRVVSLIAPHDGYLTGMATELNSLPTLHDVYGSTTAGTPIVRTIDLFTSPATLYLIADDVSELDRDYARVRQLEQTGLYSETMLAGTR